MLASGVSVDPGKVEAFMSWERLKSVFEILGFLGLAGYYMRFIEDFSRLATPMTRLTWKEVKFEWDDPCERGQRYTVNCDASKYAQGCVLMQSGRVVVYGSR